MSESGGFVDDDPSEAGHVFEGTVLLGARVEG